MRLVWSCFLLLWVMLAGAEPYFIRKFDVEMSLSSKAVLEVTERLEVVFNEPRRGIFRDIPVHYENKHGLNRSLRIDAISVTDQNGAGQTTKVTMEGEDVRIRIGDPDIYLDPGTVKTYIIRYRCRGMINWFESNEGWAPSAQLYWNVTGDRWDTRIEQTSIRVSFPKSEDGKDLRARVFVGPYGSTLNQILQKTGGPVANKAIGTQMTLGNDQFEAKRLTTLNPYEGFTFVLDLPHDSIEKPSAMESALTMLTGMLGLLIPIIIFPLGLIAWMKWGRDPKDGVLVVSYDPPEDLSGAESGTLLDDSVDRRDLSSAFFSLAIKGHLTIHPKEEGLIFKHRTAEMRLTNKADTSDLNPLESKLLRYMRGGGTVIDETDLRHDVAPYMMELKSTLYGMLVDRGYYRHNPDSARGTTFGVGLVLIVVLGVIFTNLDPFRNPVPSIIGGIVGFIMIAVFSTVMPRRTVAGARARDQVRGFEEFMRRAQGEEMDWLAKHQPDLALFEKYLPHAIAFGLAKEWAKRFEGTLTEMPSWYVTGGHYHFNSVYFSDDVVSISDSLGSAAATPPRSSGSSGGGSGFSSGGGFSGGGFGGGGGGSW